MPHRVVRVAVLAVMACGCHDEDPNAVLNRLIQLTPSAYTIENPEVDDSVTVSSFPSLFTLSPGTSSGVAFSFDAPNSNVIGAAIRFGDKGPIHVVPFESAHHLPMGEMAF